MADELVYRIELDAIEEPGMSMYARGALHLAKQEAQRLNATTIEPWHLLAGLLKSGDPLCQHLLQEKIGLKDIRDVCCDEEKSNAIIKTHKQGRFIALRKGEWRFVYGNGEPVALKADEPIISVAPDEPAKTG